jgi:hypothetical protein
MTEYVAYPVPPKIPHDANFSTVKASVTYSYVNTFEFVNMSHGKIINLEEPTEDTDAATKAYVDAHSGGSGDLTGPITAISGISSITSQSGIGSTFLMSNNPTITGGNLYMTFGLIRNLADPLLPTDAATKDYVDSKSTADLIGPITSVGNVTSIALQTGTGTTFAMKDSPILINPTLGNASATSIDTDELNVLSGGNILLTGKLISTNTTNTSGLLTGAIYTPGGISASKDAIFGGTCSADEFLATSDKKLKFNIELISDKDKSNFRKIKGYRYNLRNDPVKKYGVIAQELEENDLGLLVDNSDKHKRVSYLSLIPLMIETIHELEYNLEEQRIRHEKLLVKVDMMEEIIVSIFKRDEKEKIRLKNRKSNNRKSNK